MQFSAARRTAKTYGKGNRNPRVHDLFELNVNSKDDPTMVLSEATHTSGADGPSRWDTKDVPMGGDPAISPPVQAVPVPEVLVEMTDAIPRARSAPDASMFDIDSSDENTSTDTSGSRASKRRRTAVRPESTTLYVQKHPETGKARDPPKKITAKRQAPGKDSQSTVAKVKRSAPELKQRILGTSELPSHPAPFPPKQTAVRTLPHNMKTKTSNAASSKSGGSNNTDNSATDGSDKVLEPVRRVKNTSRTKAAKRALSIDSPAADLPSPGRFGLTALQLDAVSTTSAHLSPDPSSDGSLNHKNRRRLIDRLDAPIRTEERISDRQAVEPTPSSTVDKSQRLTQSRGKSSDADSKRKSKQKSQVQSEESDSTRTRIAAATKPRTTYATQRSYLSDMVDDVDTLAGPSSQKSTDELLLQAPAFTTASQLELEEDSDDQSGAGRIKSIHELRQAGANNRFDREIDAILEDIDTRDLSSRAVRLQALMKLSTKLEQPAFLRQLAVSTRAARLVSLAMQPTDVITSGLFVGSISLLSRSEDIPVPVLNSIFRAASDLAPSMLAEDRTLSKIARDRKQNLSKMMVRDLANFENSIGGATDLPLASTKIYPDTIVLDCLEIALRKLIHLGDTSVRLSTFVYSQILRLLVSGVEQLPHNQQEPAVYHKLQIALSLLELCSVVIDDADLHVADGEYESLGNALANVIFKTENLPESLEKSVLQAVVSLSNNRPRMCQLLGNTSINKATFGIINNHFLNLARQAETEETFDESKFDSVVLALGCLMNFAECDSTLRVRLSKMQPGKENYVSQLVSIFNFQVSKIDEAMTREQGQVSVAFGYLSMLLCTLSLHPSIKRQVTQLLRNKSFEELCTAAEKFFTHLRTLEHISDDDTSMETFTARFRAILETIRVSNG